MNFFQQLAAVRNIDLTMRIMQKDDELTINIMPGNKSTLKPIIVTGTGEELDKGFFETVFPAVQHLAGLATNFDEVKKDIEGKIAEKAKPKESSKPKPKEEKKPEVKKSSPKKEVPAAVEPDLFGDEDPDEEHENKTEE